MAYPTNRLSIHCPQCGQPLTMTAQQVIDVGEDPTLRDRLLRGRVNVLSCPHCGVKGPIALPLVYHDPSHELLLAFLPNEMQLTMEQEEREVGRLTNMVLNNTPPEKRKGYLLNPTRVMSYDGLMEKIMEAEGVSPDQMRKQTEKIRLLLQHGADGGQRRAAEHADRAEQGEVDKNFLTLIAATMAQAQEVGDEETVRRYRTLQQKLVQQLNLKASDLPTFDAAEQYDALIEALLATEPERLQTMVATNRPLLDYQFFMHLTQRAEAADAPTKQQLLALRKQVVELTDEMDRHAEQAMRRAAEQLQTLLQAPDIDAKIQEMYNDLDEAFLVVLSANLEQAEAQGYDEIVERAAQHLRARGARYGKAAAPRTARHERAAAHGLVGSAPRAAAPGTSHLQPRRLHRDDRGDCGRPGRRRARRRRHPGPPLHHRRRGARACRDDGLCAAYREALRGSTQAKRPHPDPRGRAPSQAAGRARHHPAR